MKLTIYQVNKNQKPALPYFSTAVKAGFPSPADDPIEEKLDLNSYLIEHPAATFFVRVEGDSMHHGGIQHGDLLVVDRSLSPKHGSIVIAVINGEFTVKRVKIQSKKLFLIPDNPEFPILEVTSEMDFQAWGVVTYVIHKTS